jgi:hypothetical protein
MGSEPQIYFYADRHSATGYIYTYPLMENQKYAFKMQKEMIEEIEKAQPKYLVFVNVFGSWIVRERSVKYIFNWYQEYARENFDLVGVINMLSGTKTEYRWDNEAANHPRRSSYFLRVYKRKSTND